MNLLQFLTKENDASETGLHLKNSIIGSIVAQLKQLALLPHAIKGINLYITSPDGSADELAHRAVLSSPNFKTDLQRHLADHFLELPTHWQLSVETKTDEVEQYIALSSVLRMQIESTSQAKAKKVEVQALSGKLWQESYELLPEANAKYAIGRGKTPQLESGRVHKNQIPFIAPDEEGFDETSCEPNKYVSRSHGFIVYDPVQQQFAFKLAAGVFESGHHTRIVRTNGAQDETIAINNESILYYLKNGDQIQFNRKAVLEFLLNDTL